MSEFFLKRVVRQATRAFFMNAYFRKKYNFLYCRLGIGKIFHETFKNRRVAVVGSAPSTIGEAQGALIDSYDLVVRINFLKPTGRERELGSRTDVRFLGATLLDRHVPFLNDITTDTILFSSDKNKDFLDRQGRAATYFPRQLPGFVVHGLATLSGSSSASGIPILNDHPRSGLVFLYLLLKFGHASTVRLFGFSQSKDDAMLSLHYDSGAITPYDPALYKNNHISALAELDILRNLKRDGFLKF